jgi:ferredoxin
MKVLIDREACLGCGVCEALCLEVFKLLDDGKSGIVEKYRKGNLGEGEVSDDLASCVENAKNFLPSRSDQNRIALLASRGTVEWNVLPKKIPPVCFCYGFSFNQNLQHHF